MPRKFSRVEQHTRRHGAPSGGYGEESFNPFDHMEFKEWEPGIYEAIEPEGIDGTLRVFFAATAIGPEAVLLVDKAQNYVELIYVDKQLQGKGVANMMMEEAEKVCGPITQVSRELSPQGQGWSEHKGLEPIDDQIDIEDARAVAEGSRVILQLNGLYNADALQMQRLR